MKRTAGILLILVITAELGLIWWTKTIAPVGIIGWVETDDASLYYDPSTQDPPYDIDEADIQLLVSLVADDGILDGNDSEFETISALRNWTRVKCPVFESGPNTSDPSEILEHFSNGNGGICGTISTLYCAVLKAHNYRARIVNLLRNDRDIHRWKKGVSDSHVTVEVYSTEHHKWFVSDATFNCWFHSPDTDTPLSARDLQLIPVSTNPDFSEMGGVTYESAGLIVSETDGFDTLPRTEMYYVDPVLLYQNVFLLYYDVFENDPGNTLQKIGRLINSRIQGNEKIVRLLKPGENPSLVPYLNTLTNWLPVVMVFLLLTLLIPHSHRADDSEDEDDNTDDED